MPTILRSREVELSSSTLILLLFTMQAAVVALCLLVAVNGAHDEPRVRMEEGIDVFGSSTGLWQKQKRVSVADTVALTFVLKHGSARMNWSHSAEVQGDYHAGLAGVPSLPGC